MKRINSRCSWTDQFTSPTHKSRQSKNNSRFNHANVKNLWFEVSGRHYPEESLDLDWDNNNYCLACNAYQDYKRVFNNSTDTIPYVDKKDFKNLYPIYSIDLTDQPKRISGVKSNIILHIDFNKDVPAPTGTDKGTVCYVIVVSKYLLPYEPTKNRITEKIN